MVFFSRVVREGKDGKVYLGTNDGLYVYDLKKHSAQMLTIKDGLPDNGIASIENDAQGRLWIGTDHGLGCLNTTTGRVMCFYVDRGLQSNEFTDGASFMSEDGRELFAWWYGWHYLANNEPCASTPLESNGKDNRSYCGQSGDECFS